MGFRSIGTLASDVLAKLELNRAEQASALESAQPAARRGFGISGDGSLEGGETTVAFAHRGEEKSRAQNELGKVARPKPRRVEDSVAVKEPTRLAPRVMPTIADMSMVTVTAATKGMPQPSAVIIDMMAWKAARNHASSPTRRVAR